MIDDKDENILRPSTRVARVFEVARLCGHASLETAVLTRWTTLIMESQESPGPAIEVADKYELRSLTGAAYYSQLLSMQNGFRTADEKILLRAEETEQKISSESARLMFVLTAQQKMRLICGYWSLTRIWERLAQSPIKFDDHGCTTPDIHVQTCVYRWNRAWKDSARSDAILKHRNVDVLNRLKSLRDQLKKYGLSMSPYCQQQALSTIDGMIERMRNNLADHFKNRLEEQDHIHDLWRAQW